MPLVSIKTLGSGGFGVVDLVRSDDGSVFARKTLLPTASLAPEVIQNIERRFAREAKTQSGIRHHNIVPVVRAELSASPPYYLMPAAVCSLQEDLDRDRTLGGKWLNASADIVAGLDELHQMGIYHRDLKPQNVLRYPGKQGAPDFYAISDFGLIAMNESRLSVLTVTGMAKGTDYYTAPEITSDLRKASAQSDIYSLGCIIHEMVGTDTRVPCHEIKENGNYSAILRSCTRTDPQRRFRSVRSVLDALVSITTELPAIVARKSAEFGNQLASGEALDEPSWRALIDFVEDDESTNDAKAVLRQLRLDQVSDLCSHSTEFGDRLGQVYSRWVQGSAFAFERTDSIANILEVFIRTCSLETKADALMAMLDLGTSHNRWYVERMFCSLCSAKMDDSLARRLSVEFRAGGADVCRSIDHLKRSIGVETDILHPVIQQTLKETCS
jgi:eukaryotic-like serine/threonine-protein kinase